MDIRLALRRAYLLRQSRARCLPMDNLDVRRRQENLPSGLRLDNASLGLRRAQLIQSVARRLILLPLLFVPD